MEWTSCDAWIATSKDDDELRAKVAQKWSKMFESAFRPEDIDCAGCTSAEGPHVGYCSECAVRKCSIERKVANCAHCGKYPCTALNVHFEFVAPGARETLEKIRGALRLS